MKKIILFLISLYCLQAQSQSVLAPRFDTLTMQFSGSKTEQAKYLLRHVKKYGNPDADLKELPSFLDKILSGRLPVVSVDSIVQYLQVMQIPDSVVGGPFDKPVSNTATGVTANYFIIHDASNFVADSDTFPVDINESSWKGNILSKYIHFANTHVFVNRLGESLTSNNFSERIHATKFESKIKNPELNGACLGDFIHIELIQPRIHDPGSKNDAIAPEPGFTLPQYERLALLYIIVSSRKGDWLVPSFHAVIDEGIKDAHDDPQHFELDIFSEQVHRLYQQLTGAQ